MVTFRRPPRSPPPKPPTGKNVIPFDVKRTRPPGVKSLGELKPDPDNLINLEQIKKAKEIELRNAIQSEGMSPFPEGKGLSELGEEVPVKTDTEKYNEAIREQQKTKDLSHLDDWMVTEGEYDINKLLEYRNLNKSTEELVNDLQYMLDYVDWKSDYTRSGRHSKAEAFTAKEKKEIAAAERREQGSSGLLGIDLRKQRDIGEFFHLLSDEIEKRMRDE